MDPLFWVAHGAMERSFQRLVFSNMFTDMKYTTEGHCSGHSAVATKAWLEGLYFVDETVDITLYTNEQLTAALDPSSIQYRDLINFVYDTGTYAYCENSESWFNVV